MSSTSIARGGSASVLASICAAAVATLGASRFPRHQRLHVFAQVRNRQVVRCPAGFPFGPSTESSLEVVS
jgi:hypothetical protein